jgi:dTMP kinase
VFLTFEGIDGSGKSTQAALLAESLRAEGREVLALREPGGTPLGERIRDVLLHGPTITPWAEAALFAAARAELVAQVIQPALDRGATVVCDRYLDSSLVYQGFARGLGIDAVYELNLTVTGGLLPHRTFVLLLEADAGRARLTGAPDRIEREDGAFVRRLAEGYAKIVLMFPERCVALDASKPSAEIAEEVRDELARVGARAG